MSDQDGARATQFMISLVEMFAVLLTALLVISVVISGVWGFATGQSYTVTVGEEDIVGNYTTTEGEQIVDDVWRDGDDTHVRLSGNPSDYGISKAYLYSDNETVSKNLEPRQKEIKFGFISFFSESSEIVFYDGNNRAVSSVTVNYSTKPVTVTWP